jgi:hypothetical protein
MSLCSAAGNSGLPVIIQGDIDRAAIINKKVQKMTFKTSLSQRSVPRTYDATTGFIDELAGQDTFVFNSCPYQLQAVQVYNIRNQDTPLPTLEGGRAFDGPASFGLALSFSKLRENYSGENVLMILIPIYSQTNVANGGKNFHSDIDAYFRDMRAQEVSKAASSLGVFLNYDSLRISYTTCIELKDSQPLTVRVLLFPGYVIQNTTAELFRDPTPLRIPGQLRDFKPTAFRRSLNSANELQVSQWSDEGYCYNSMISVGDDKFGVRFIFYDSKIVPVKGPIKAGQENAIPTSQYKCIPLDKVRDISNNLVIVDPITKSRVTLQDELDADQLAKQAEIKDTLPNADSNGTRDFVYMFANIIVAVIVVVVFGFIFYKIGQRFHTTELAVAAAVALNAANAARSAGSNKGEPGSANLEGNAAPANAGVPAASRQPATPTPTPAAPAKSQQAQMQERV